MYSTPSDKGYKENEKILQWLVDRPEEDDDELLDEAPLKKSKEFQFPTSHEPSCPTMYVANWVMTSCYT